MFDINGAAAMSLCDQILLQLAHLATTAWSYKPDNYKHGAAGSI